MDKHVICFRLNRYDYFKLALDLWNTHNVTSLLEEKGITLGHRYDYHVINIMRTNEIDSNPHISCVSGSHLAEIHMCVDAATPTTFVSCFLAAKSKCKAKKIDCVR